MKLKEGRDFLELDECVVSIKEDKIVLSNVSESFSLDYEEVKKLVEFVEKKKFSKPKIR